MANNTANKKSFVISDPKILEWLSQHTEDNSRTNGISAITRQLISLGVLLYERGFRINEMGQLLKQINSDELSNFMSNLQQDNVANKGNDNNKVAQDGITSKFQKFAHL
jgi:hypothetical protein